MASSTDETNNHHPWKKNAWESRQAVSESLIALGKDYPPRKTVNVSEYHEMAQTYLFEYFSVFEPKKAEFGGDEKPDARDDSLWWESLIAVDVPVSGQAKLNGNANVLQGNISQSEVLSAVHENLPTERHVLSLGNIRRLFQTQNNFQLKVRGWVPNQGTETMRIVETRYMPVAAIREARQQLDNCLEDAGWLPQIESTPRTEITDELMEEVEEWRQANIQ